MKTLIIAEKPSVSACLADVLGAKSRKDGYLCGNGYLVSWCLGHLVELASAEEYDAKYTHWRREDLPICPVDWKTAVTQRTKKQFDARIVK